MALGLGRRVRWLSLATRTNSLNRRQWSAWSSAVFASLILAPSLIQPPSASAKQLIDVEARRALVSRPVTSRLCSLVTALPAKLTSVGFYKDPPVNSEVDPEKERQFYAAMAPVRNAEESISQNLTNFVRADRSIAAPYAHCALAQISQFATDRAMLDSDDYRSSGQVRLMALAPIFAFVVLRDAGQVSASEDAAIKEWIRALANLVIKAEDEHPYGNNIDVWGAAALEASGVALHDSRLETRAAQVASTTLDEVSADGLLPKEIARGEKSLEYSLFATQALASIYVLADRTEASELRDRNHHALFRLMRAMVHAIADPEWFAAISHNPLSVARDKIYAQNLGWLAIYPALRTDPDTQRAYCHFQPLYVFRAGGDWGVYFAPKLKC